MTETFTRYARRMIQRGYDLGRLTIEEAKAEIRPLRGDHAPRLREHVETDVETTRSRGERPLDVTR